MKRTGLFFDWERGSKNSNALAVFNRIHVRYEYNHYGQLTVDLFGIGDFKKIEYAHVKNNTFEICIV